MYARSWREVDILGCLLVAPRSHMQLRCMNVEVKLPYGQACSASYVRQQCANIRAPYQALAGCKTLVSDQSLFIDFGDQEAPLHVPPGLQFIFFCYLFWCF